MGGLCRFCPIPVIKAILSCSEEKPIILVCQVGTDIVNRPSDTEPKSFKLYPNKNEALMVFDLTGDSFKGTFKMSDHMYMLAINGSDIRINRFSGFIIIEFGDFIQRGICKPGKLI